jgi:tetratricopeptide (TPR) repeat protein
MSLYLKEGRRAAREGHHALVLENFSKARPADLTIDDLFSWGVAYYSEGDKPNAVLRFEQILQADADYYLALNGLGLLKSESHDWEEAVSFLERAIQINPTDPRAFINKGLAIAGMEDHQEALRLYQHAATCDFASSFPSQRARDHAHAVLSYNWANSLVTIGDYELAREKFVRAIEYESDFFLAHHNLALLLWEVGSFSEARGAWRRAYVVYRNKSGSPQNRKHAAYAGFALLNALGDEAQAEIELLRALDHAPERVPTLITLLSLYKERAERVHHHASSQARSKAARIYARALEVLHREDLRCSTKGMCQVAQLHRIMGKDDAAIAVLLEAEKMSPGWSKIHLMLGSAYLAQDEFARAVTHLNTGLAGSPRLELPARIELATALRRTGAVDQAERELRKVLEISPYFLDALAELARLYLESSPGSTDEYSLSLAHRYYTLLLQKARSEDASRSLNPPQVAEAVYSRAVTRLRLMIVRKELAKGNAVAEVKQDLELALSMEPTHPRALHARERLRGFESNAGGALAAYAPWLIITMAGWLFVLAQVAFLATDSGRLGAEQYIFVSFGSVLILTAGCLLPTLLKLKFAAFELEVGSEQKSRIEDFSWVYARNST